MKKGKVVYILFIVLTAIVYFQSCSKANIPSSNLSAKLSDYAIFKGNTADLIPNSDYKLYELSSQLFSDYSEKQRLIKIPDGTKLTAIDNGLVDFPEGTIIVKTFYYHNDKRDATKGKKIIETRLLLKTNGIWNVGTYVWNDAQTDASLIKSGLNKTVNWIDKTGTGKVISYHIPNTVECGSCHNAYKIMMPIGPKIRNLNFNVIRNGASLNQLTYLYNAGVLNGVNPASFENVPNYKDTTVSLEKRARAYLDINCAHCHSDKGFAAVQTPRFGYEHSLQNSKITEIKPRIKRKLENGHMPKIGTVVIDEEGVSLIKKFIDGL
jgi:uncharacterized repeat protein (TIGR03806 family)